MICENCKADVPKIYEGSDGRKYCCSACLFYPLGCRCKFGELGIAQDDFPYDDDDIDDDNDYQYEDELGVNDPSICGACLESLDQFGQCVCCDF